MKQIFLTLLLGITLPALSDAQAITAGFVQVYTHTKAIVPVVKGRDDFQNTSHTFSISYEYFFKKKKYSILTSYMKFDGCTWIFFEPGGLSDGVGDLLAIGYCGGVNLRRFDIDFVGSLTQPHKKFYLKPFSGIGFQWSQKTEKDFWSDGLRIDGPNYFELEPIFAERINTTQIVPSAGFRTGFVFWKRVDIGLSVRGVYAFRPYQKMFLKYQYKGEIQPTAEYASTGTGLFVTLGIGYRFAKLIERQQNK